MRNKKQFALQLLKWHGGQWTGVYAVGSTLLAASDGMSIEPDKDSIERAIGELKRVLETFHKPPTKKIETMIRKLAELL